MSDLEQRFAEDRALRNAAKANFMADIEHAKATFSGKGLAERTVNRIGEGAKDVFEKASDAADSNRGILAALIGAVVLWFARNPILDALAGEESADPTELDQETTDEALPQEPDDPDPLTPGADDD